MTFKIEKIELDLKNRLTNIGFTAFCVGMYCEGMHNPRLHAVIGILVMFLLINCDRRNNPHKVMLNKLWKKKNRTKEEMMFIKEVNSFSFIVKEYPVFIIGIASLVIVALQY